MMFPRRSGILLHPTSLPGRFGIGDLGAEAYRFADFLSSAGQTYWQVLPLSPTGYGDSPYQTLSAFAGNPLLVDPRRLVELGHLSDGDLNAIPQFPDDRVDFGPVIRFKTELLDRAFENFRRRAPSEQLQAFARFCRDQADWLEDFALFIAVKEAHDLRPWNDWERGIARREPEAVRLWKARLHDRIENHKYRQWIFFEQWLGLKYYANERGLRIFGDIPIFVSYDSADVWAHPELFHLDKNLKPLIVSGVPPDYFSETGQLWGHPLYRWDVMRKTGYRWWIERFRMAFTQSDVVRIDHFRGFFNYWQVPAGEMTAVKGRWVKGPGATLFRAVTAALGELAVVAEDLGDFTPESRAGVDKLQKEFGYPGMRVLQFAFSDGPADPFLPHNLIRDCLVYTGTHDNDTAVGWYQVSSTETERDYARKYLGRDGSDIPWDLIRLGWSSVAHTAMTTVQDLLSMGHETRMNTPGTSGPPNWCWRMLPGSLGAPVQARLRELTAVYGRTPDTEQQPLVLEERSPSQHRLTENRYA